jgi:eukaryotic-like serine/threonine-protein kinase
MLQVGESIGRFTVVDRIGEGGIATVYRVRHATLQTVHALKLLNATRADLSRRLLQEGRIQARLRHPNVVAVTDVLEIGGQTGLLMECVDGSSLRDVLDEGRLDREEAMSLFHQVLSGVAAAHRAGVLHRDLKPANILLAVTSRGVVAKVTDFGIAKVTRDVEDKAVTRAGAIMGTPGYMAPEQLEDSGRVDLRADIYALGCILYEMLTGDAPFLRNDLFATLAATTNGDYVPLHERLPDLPPEVHLAVARALEMDPELRFSSCEELAEALYGEAAPLDPGEATAPFDGRPPDARSPDAPRSLSNPTLAPGDLGHLRRALEERSTRVSSETFVLGEAAKPAKERPSQDTLAPPMPRPKREPVPVPDEATLREEFDRLKAPPPEPGERLAPGVALADDALDRANTAAGRFVLLLIRGAGFFARYVAGPAALLIFFGWREAERGATIVETVRAQRVEARMRMESTLQKQVAFVGDMQLAGANTSAMDRYVADYTAAATLDEKIVAGDKLLGEMQRELAAMKLRPHGGTPEDEIRRRALDRQILAMSTQFREYRELEAAWGEQLDAPETGFATAIGMVDPID